MVKEVNETELTASITVLSTVNGTNIVKIFRNATQYYVTARDSNGNYLPENTEIDFNINGVFYYRESDDDGVVKMNINLNPGDYIVVPKMGNDNLYFVKYIIRDGDTIYSLSRRYNVDPKYLLRLNGLNESDIIYSGDYIFVPREGVPVTCSG